MLSMVLSPFCLAGVAVLPPVLLDVSVNAAEPLLPDELLLPHAARPKHRQVAKIIFLIKLPHFLMPMPVTFFWWYRFWRCYLVFWMYRHWCYPAFFWMNPAMHCYHRRRWLLCGYRMIRLPLYLHKGICLKISFSW